MRRILLLLLTFVAVAPAAAEETRELRRTIYLQQMRERAEETRIRPIDGKKEPKLEEKPIFRYDDQQRGFIDATIWAWTVAGRPVAFEKIEVMLEFKTKPLWNCCFASLSEDRLQADLGQDRRFQAKEPGVSFQPVASAPPPATKQTERRRQLRDLARSFSARVTLDPNSTNSEEMRLLATPLFEYVNPESKLMDLAVFGYSTAGTNPDMLVVFELREKAGKRVWHYSPVRMTAGGVTLKHANATVYEVPFVLIQEAPFPTWTFFQYPRVPLPGELPEVESE